MLRRLTPWLALVGLVAATVVLWQTRFAAVPHPLNGDAGFEAGFDGWIKSGGKNGLRQENGSTVVRFAKPAHDGEFQSATRWFGSLEELRYLHVEVETKWSDVIVGVASWASHRLVLITKDAKGRTRFTWDHGAYLAHGTEDWHKEEGVFELTPAMSEVGLAFQMLGRQGNMEVRKFRITGLKRRPWVPAATVLLVAGWALWLAMRLRSAKAKVAWWRVLPAAGVVVAASWFLVFPGPRIQYRPLIGQFAIGTVEPAPIAAAKPDAAPTLPVSTPAKPPPARVKKADAAKSTAHAPNPASQAGTPPNPKPPAAKPPPPEPRSKPRLTDAIRKLDLRLNVIHISAFFGLSIGVFLLVGNLQPWRMLSVIALLSEAVPNWHDRWVDAADLLDLAANLGGVALGAGAFFSIQLLVKKLPPFRSPVAS